MKRFTIIALLMVASVVAFGQAKRTPRNDFTFFQAYVEPNILLNHLVAYWPMEEAAGQDRIDSTNSYVLRETGTVIQEANHKGGSFAAGVYSTSFLTNTGDAAFFTTNSLSGSFWVLFTNTPISGDTLVARWGPSLNWMMWISTAGGQQVVQLITVENISTPLNSTVSLTPSNYFHVAFGIDTTNNIAWLQVNNEARTNQSYTPPLTLTSDPITVGGNLTVPTGNGVGTFIDEVAFWDRLLSTNEVRQLYNGGAGLFYGSFR